MLTREFLVTAFRPEVVVAGHWVWWLSLDDEPTSWELQHFAGSYADN